MILEYNFREVSSILLRSTYLRFWVSDRWKEVIWAIKRFGLMYQLDSPSITVDGPATLMHNTRAYGLGISRLFYFITKAKQWWSYTVIPDFLFEKGGIRVYMEIVGFWTAEYLERKFRKLKEVNVDNLIVAIDSSNYKGKLPEIRGNIFMYKKTPDAYKVNRILMELERPLRDKMLERAMSVKVAGDIVSINKIASETGLPEDIVREAFIRNIHEGYLFDGKNLISSGKAERLRTEILQLNTDDANQALNFLSKAGIDASISTLMALGFNIEWHGLEAKIKF